MEHLPRVKAAHAVAQRILRVPKNRFRAKPIFIAVVGAAPSGRGHLIGELLRHLNEGAEQAIADVVSLDAYRVGRGRMQKLGVVHPIHPMTVDLRRAANDLSRMRVGASCRIPYRQPPPEPWPGDEEREFQVTPIVIVEGFFALHAEILAKIGYECGVYVESDIQSALLQKFLQDADAFGQNALRQPRQALQAYFTQVVPSLRDFIEPTIVDALKNGKPPIAIVKSYYDPFEHVLGTDDVRRHLRTSGEISSEDIARRIQGRRLGPPVAYTDLFYRPKKAVTGEFLRVRGWDGAFSFTYQGPLLTCSSRSGDREASPEIELGAEALQWLLRDYVGLERFDNTQRTFHLVEGPASPLYVLCDTVDILGPFVKICGPDGTTSQHMADVLSRLGLRRPYHSESYFQLWNQRRGS